MPDPAVNPAEEAARRSWAKVEKALDTGTIFVFEAGAGAGKTYSLLQTLDHLIPRHAREYLRRRQQIACITYTRVARDMILTSTDRHPAVYCETTHAFAWELMRQFQKQIREAVLGLDAWSEPLAVVEATETLSVNS